ncbi:MAG: hypothetical protein ABIG89_02200 [Candidatus Woesearchaeota archaeon]
MTSAEEHKIIILHFLDDINEKIRANLLVERQKIIGFSVSEASTNLLEYFLHKKNIITSGFRINHNYFASERRAERYLDFEFPNKKEIIDLMVMIDESRCLLCYGKEKKEELIREAISILIKIKEIIETELGEKI